MRQPRDDHEWRSGTRAISEVIEITRLLMRSPWIELPVVMSVVALLAHKLSHLLPQLGNFDCVIERAHRVDEEFLTVRKYG